MGVGVTNGLGRLLFANQIAQRILATRDGIEVTAQGTLDTLKKCCSPSLKVLLQEHAQDRLRGTSRSGGTALAVTTAVRQAASDIARPLARWNRAANTRNRAVDRGLYIGSGTSVAGDGSQAPPTLRLHVQ